MSRDDTYFRLRVPDEVKAWVKKAADENRRSMTGQIVFVLEQAMRNEKSGTTA